MKKLPLKYIVIILSSITIASCSKILDKQSLVNSTAAQVYNDSATAVLSLNYIYTQNLPSWFGNGSVSAIASAGPCNLTEECRSDNIYVKGTVTQESVGDIGTSNSASTNYGKIRVINQFIQDINVGTINPDTKNRFIAQALFWRAFRYFELVKLYGGVPLVLTPLSAVGAPAKAAAMVPRSSTTATFQQIVTDLDSAINYLPGHWTAVDYGHITKGAAQAYLGRVLLTWASPQFNPGNDVSRWQAAYDASTAAIATLSVNGNGLYPKEDVTMWTTEGPNADGSPKNPEAVMVTEYNTATDDNGMANNSYTNATLPKYIGTSGGSNQPTWDEVQAFPMVDGFAPGSSPTYDYNPQTFFLNRDPRFYQTIAYNGCSWPVVGNPNFRLWTYYYYSNKAGTATKSTESSASSTGFYCRKAIDPNISAANLVYSGTDWQEIRYAEVLLNQAESAAEIGHIAIGQEAYDNLIAIRERAGIEPGNDGMFGLQSGMDQDQMISAIMFERQIEFAYEGRRYWDLRRRNLLEGTLNGTQRQGLTVLLNNTGSGSDYPLLTRDAAVAPSIDSLAAYYLSNFTVTPVNVDTYPIMYQTADHFFGIPTAALQNNIALIQNNTWGGSFDPLQ